MGSSPSKPEFVSMFEDKFVKFGDDIIFECEANTEKLTVSWMKSGDKLKCMKGKHTITQTGTSLVLKIKNAEGQDEGKYTITIENKSGSSSWTSVVTIELPEWRTVQWNQDQMTKSLKSIKIGNDKVKNLQLLLCGPIGAGKSSVIDTIKTIFEGRMFVSFLATSQMLSNSTSHTIRYKKDQVGNGQGGLCPIVLNDIMGVEYGELNGVRSEDIVKTLKGHVKEGYQFNSKSPLPDDNHYYHKDPTINDWMHCLVYVIPADIFSMIKDEFSKKMKSIREKAGEMGLTQVVLMTKVDCTCPLTKKNLRNVYKSKKVKDKMEECSLALGIPMNCIFPVKNYHEETEINEDIHCLMLHALTNIAFWANDYLVKHSKYETFA